MYYQLFELNHAAVSPLRAAADAMRLYLRNPLNPLSHTPAGKSVAAACEVFERATRRYGKPEWDIASTMVGGTRVAVTPRTVWSRPFCNLVHFERALQGRRSQQPRLLIVAPMSGHYATLLRGTVEAMLPRHDVYITDWVDARMVPITEGRFDLDDYIDYVVSMLHFLGPDVHVLGVCQPAVPVFAAVALMEEANDPFTPRTMTLMGGPIDTRISPTEVNNLAGEHGLDWFKRNVITAVPWPHPGFMRLVYPGFLQLSGFMGMNLDRHLMAQREFYQHLVRGDGDSAAKHRQFYDEYLSVMDLSAEFFLQTVDTVFIRHALPRGEMTHRGRPVDPSAIRRTAMLTVEGEKDDISGLGQTEAAHRLTVNLPAERRHHYVQAGVGHYGVFNGSRFRSEIAPRISDFILTYDREARDGDRVKARPARAGSAEKPESARKAKRAEAADVTSGEAATEAPVAADAPAPAGQPPEPAAAPEPAPSAVEAAVTLTSLVMPAPEGAADDLTRITGIGPKLAEKLNALGIFHFRQLSAMDGSVRDELDAAVGARGRVARDDWTGQARRLAAH